MTFRAPIGDTCPRTCGPTPGPGGIAFPPLASFVPAQEASQRVPRTPEPGREVGHRRQGFGVSFEAGNRQPRKVIDGLAVGLVAGHPVRLFGKKLGQVQPRPLQTENVIDVVGGSRVKFLEKGNGVSKFFHLLLVGGEVECKRVLALGQPELCGGPVRGPAKMRASEDLFGMGATPSIRPSLALGSPGRTRSGPRQVHGDRPVGQRRPTARRAGRRFEVRSRGFLENGAWPGSGRLPAMA